jgi:hypothetical protein
MNFSGPERWLCNNHGAQQYLYGLDGLGGGLGGKS